MITFRESTQKAQVLALYYAKKLENKYALDVFACKKDITSQIEATEIIDVFYEIHALAVEDHQNDITIPGVEDLEYWTMRLYNIVFGYVEKLGYKTKI